MIKLNYLNVGCGNKFHKDWINVDMISNSPHVESHNLLKGIPFSDDQFEVIYHSQVLEHFPKEKASDFVRECFRVLKPGGVIRIVVPDLENIVNEYNKYLQLNLESPNRQTEANYDWIILEMFDQMVRNYSGGQMAEFLRQPELINEHYIVDRFGYAAKSIRKDYLAKEEKRRENVGLIKMAKKIPKYVMRKLQQYFSLSSLKQLFSSQEKRIGAFRAGGEIHQWMYDRFSLSRLLKKSGFENVEVKTPFESSIPQWNKYELDVKNGVAIDPTSLFMEARKP